MEQKERLKLLTGADESNFELLSLLLELAEEHILAETNRSVMIPQLKQAQLDLAVIAYNRMGTEGETSRSEGGISTSFADMPDKIKSVLERYRLVRCGGHAYEKTAVEDVQPEAEND